MRRAIHMIVAYAKNRVIGKDNQLLWHLADDMAFFKKMTSGHIVIMGRKTYESLPERFRPLPNRINIVLSRQESSKSDHPDLFYACDAEHAFQLADLFPEKQIFIIGGAQVYEELIPYVENIYASEVEIEIEGDASFPELPELPEANQWKKEVIDQYLKNDRNDHNFQIVKYQRTFHDEEGSLKQILTDH